MSVLPILILAAGQSSRMRGADKLLELVDGQPCLRIMAQRAVRTGHPVFVTLPSLAHPRGDCLTGLDVTPMAVPDAGLGMSCSLQRGVAALPDDVRGVMILPGDMPAITSQDMQALAEDFDCSPCDALQASTDDMRPGHPTVLGPALLQQIHTLSGDRGASALIRTALTTRLHPFQDDRARLDLDTPEDWQAWRARSS